MNLTETLVMSVPNVMVMTTSNRGHTPEELCEMAVSRLISVADTAPDAVKVQANAFKDKVQVLLLHYLKEAVKQDRITLATQLEKAGQIDTANFIRSI
jgi:hypothetical protein